MNNLGGTARCISPIMRPHMKHVYLYELDAGTDHIDVCQYARLAESKLVIS